MGSPCLDKRSRFPKRRRQQQRRTEETEPKLTNQQNILLFSLTSHSLLLMATVTPTSPPYTLSPSRAATLIQSAYRGHVARVLFHTIYSVDARASLLQRSIQRQDTVDAIRSNDKERLRVNEELMGLLLTLDGVRGMDEGIRAARRKASRRIVGLQEIVDGVYESRLLGEGDYCCWWGEVDAIEEETCRERGGDEMVEFCSTYLGFRCLQRFLHDA